MFLQSRYNRGTPDLEALRAEMIARVYPHGLPTTGVSTVENSYFGLPLPTNCARITRYTIAEPGQRPGGTARYSYLLHPERPTGPCLVFMCGHAGWSYYLPPTATAADSPIIQALAKGWRVLVTTMPAFDYNVGLAPIEIVTGGTWSYSGGSWSNVGGSKVAYYEHDLINLDSDGGPPAMCYFVHDTIVSANQVALDYPPSVWVLQGHSGGGWVGNVVAALDSRYAGWYCNVPGAGICLGGVGVSSDIEGFTAGKFFVGPGCTFDLYGMMVLAARPGRRCFLVNTTGDEYWPIVHTKLWQDVGDTLNFIAAKTGASWGLRLETGGTNDHNMHFARIMAEFADMAEWLQI